MKGERRIGRWPMFLMLDGPFICMAKNDPFVKYPAA